jgi:hypothetical protein
VSNAALDARRIGLLLLSVFHRPKS